MPTVLRHARIPAPGRLPDLPGRQSERAGKNLRRIVRGEPAFEILWRQGPGEEVPLSAAATETRQLVPYGLGLDALGDHLEIKVSRQFQARAHDRCVVRVTVHVGDERAVDLDLTD